MARWKLTEAHYLNGHPPDLDETEWEYKEIDRISGREKRKRFKVPFYFEADTIVCYEGRGQDGDFVFEGTPTPMMTPLDAEAKAISAEHEREWVHPIDSLPGQGFADALVTSFQKQMAELAQRLPNAPAPVAQAGVSKEEFEQVKAQLAALMARNAELESAPKARVGNRR